MISVAPRLALRNARPVTQAGSDRPARRKSALVPTALAYYEALCCMRLLVRTTGNRLRSQPGALNRLDASSFGEALAARFAVITGVSPSVPPVKT